MATEYKVQMKKAAAEVSAKRDQALGVFFDRKKTEGERLAAALSSGTFDSDEEVRQARELLDDHTEAPALRCAALAGMVNTVSEDDALLDRVVQLISETSENELVRLAAATTLQATEFTSRKLASRRPAYLDALRGVLSENGVASLRKFAMEQLALRNDEYLQEKLIIGLKNPAEAIAPPEEAIQLLGQNLHSEVVPLLREIVEHPPNEQSKKEALRNLAADASSAPLLERVLLDDGEPPETRHVCLVALFDTEPERATEIGRAIVQNGYTDDELRAAVLNTLTHIGSTSMGGEAEFDAYVQFLDSATSDNLKKMAHGYLKTRRVPSQ